MSETQDDPRQQLLYKLQRAYARIRLSLSSGGEAIQQVWTLFRAAGTIDVAFIRFSNA